MTLPRIRSSWLIALLFLALAAGWLLTGSIQRVGSDIAEAPAGDPSIEAQPA